MVSHQFYDESIYIKSVVFCRSIKTNIMKLFVVLREYMAYCGLRPLRSGEKYSWNCANVGYLLIFSLFGVSVTAFIFIDANTFQEYSESFYAWISVWFFFISTIFTIRMTERIFQLFENLEITINGRK